MADKSGGLGMLQTMYEEGGEEAKQDILAKLLAKLLYDHGAEYFLQRTRMQCSTRTGRLTHSAAARRWEGCFVAADLAERPVPGLERTRGKRLPGADGLFTRDEVLKMDRAAVSENYDAIREESMSLWDKDGRLPESMPERDVVDSQARRGIMEETIGGTECGKRTGQKRRAAQRV